jgi:hypothetical protein
LLANIRNTVSSKGMNIMRDGPNSAEFLAWVVKDATNIIEPPKSLEEVSISLQDVCLDKVTDAELQ